MQTTPLALVLTNANDAIVFGNIAARQLFRAGRKIEGLTLPRRCSRQAPQPMRDAVDGGADTLFTVQRGRGGGGIPPVATGRSTLNSQPHRLLLFKQLTREMAAQEVAIWKKVIRVIAHELNNSLAPITSLAHSGQMLAQAAGPERLARVFSTIEERASHLATFIDGYARFAKLPRPRPAAVAWGPLLAGLEGQPVVPRARQPLPAGRGLVRRAADRAGADQPDQERDRVGLARGRSDARASPSAHGGIAIEVARSRQRATEEVLRDALLPFYSTKPKGTGLGLTLCREIVDAHGGRLSIANREGGGASSPSGSRQPVNPKGTRPFSREKGSRPL